MADSPSDVLRQWCADGSGSMDDVVAALATSGASVDTFLAEEAAALGFADKLIGDHAFEFGFAVEDGAPLPGPRWLGLARLAPVAFAWNIEPEAVLPLGDEATARAFETLLVQSLGERENRSVLLSWLGHPDFLASGDAVDRIETALAAQGAALTWSDRLEAIKALARRGGTWEAARALERLVRRNAPDLEEARAIQKQARGVVDTTLFSVLASQRRWIEHREWLHELAESLPSEELVAAFAPANGEATARRRLEPPSPAHRAAWRILARRADRVALDAVGRLLVRRVP